MDSVPNELLVQIFIILQPLNFIDTSQFFTHNHQTLGWKPVAKQSSRRYHSSVKTNQNIPVLLILSQVNRRWRKLVFTLHPFWKQLSHFHFYRLPLPKSNKLQHVINASLFLNNIWQNIPKMNITTVTLFPAIDNYYLKVQDLVCLLQKINDPLTVRKIYLICGWMALGDPLMIETLCTFTQVKHLYLEGVVEDGVLRGFSNRSIKRFAKSFSKLTHLYLDGMGGTSFCFKTLLFLLKANPDLEVLKLKNISGVVDFKLLHDACPRLKTLILELSLSRVPQFHSGLISNALFMRLQRQRTLMPSFAGRISNMLGLKELVLVAESDEVKDKANLLLPQYLDKVNIEFGVLINL